MSLVTVGITCHGEATDLEVMLGCLREQREYTIGKHSRTGGDVYYACGEQIGCESLQIEPIVVSDGRFVNQELLNALHLSKKYQGLKWKVIECPKEGGVGHHTRDYAINAAMGDWVILTNADNYFMQGWRHRIESALRPEVGMVYWDIVSNLWRWGTQGGTTLTRGGVDLSAVCVRTEIAQTVGFRHRDYDGDYAYVRECKLECEARGLELSYINEILGVHN